MLQKLSPIFFHTARRLVGKGQGSSGVTRLQFHI